MSNATCTAGDLGEEDHFREVRVFHSNHTSNPPKDGIKGLGQVHKEDVQALILLAALFLDLSYEEYYVDCPSVSPEGTLTLGDENQPGGGV